MSLATTIILEAMRAVLDAIYALTGAVRSLVAPDVANATPRAPELARDGSLRINADIYDQLHQKHLVVAGAFTREPLAVPCDGVRVDVDGAVIYYQPRGRPWQIEDGLTFLTSAKWIGAGWTVGAGKAAHAAGTTTALQATIAASRPLLVGKRYAVVIKTSCVKAGGVTPYLGTQAGTQRTTDGTFVEVVTCAGFSGASLLPSSDFVGQVEVFQVYGRSPKLAAYTYEPFAAVEIVGIASGAALGTLLAASDTVELHACYRRVPGATDLG